MEKHHTNPQTIKGLKTNLLKKLAQKNKLIATRREERSLGLQDHRATREETQTTPNVSSAMFIVKKQYDNFSHNMHKNT